MNAPCARCNKTVYATEKVNCLDQIWHKGCFSCETCKMVLTMKNYKAFQKKPYCSAHCPSAKATAVALTPELSRLTNQTKTQSSIAYKAEYEKHKAAFTEVADTPAMSVYRQNASLTQAHYRHTLPETHQDAEEQPEPHPASTSTNVPAPSAYTAARSHPAPPQSTYSAVPEPVYAGAPESVYSAPPKSVYSAPPEPVYTAPPEPVYTAPPQSIYEPAPAQEESSNYSAPPTGTNYRALYDYQATDVDEVSFSVGDIIVNGEIVAEGWMKGTVEISGQFGLLPSNYVEPV